ncbi:class III lanthionine synthetase LanKC N-terminal domain-containing protein [Paenibacillus sp. TH7-28]
MVPSETFQKGQMFKSMSNLLTFEKHENEWTALCETYLPVVSEKIWRQSRAVTEQDPKQGWKLHVSATILCACNVFKQVAPFLSDLGVLFKAPRSMLELKKLNCGMHYGYSQIGKFITVYPQSEEDALFLANELHNRTIHFSGPVVPYDIIFQAGSRVHYRYGSFSNLEMQDQNGKSVPAVRTPEGDLVPDLREPGAAVPEWITDPFAKQLQQDKPKKFSPTLSPLQTTILAYEALSQRGKSGVYRSLDISVSPARLCILKEGRRDGETDWDSRDGYWRVRQEANVLNDLILKGVKVPKVYTTFEEGGNYYLAMELVEGDNLQTLLRKKLSIQDALRYGIQLAKLLNAIHTSGWVWRDCKPLNLIVTKQGFIRPIDFEGACRIECPDDTEWGTQGYLPPEWNKPFIGQSRLPEDLYALGATLHQLFSGQTPRTATLTPVGKLRRKIPFAVRKIISALLDSNPDTRPASVIVLQTLENAYTENFGEIL